MEKYEYAVKFTTGEILLQATEDYAVRTAAYWNSDGSDQAVAVRRPIPPWEPIPSV